MKHLKKYNEGLFDILNVCNNFLPKIEEDGVLIPKRTSQLNKTQFKDYLDQIYYFYTQEGVGLILPDDKNFGQFYDEYLEQTR